MANTSDKNDDHLKFDYEKLKFNPFDKDRTRLDETIDPDQARRYAFESGGATFQ